MKDQKVCVIGGFELAKRVSGPRSITQDDMAKLCTEVSSVNFEVSENIKATDKG